MKYNSKFKEYLQALSKKVSFISKYNLFFLGNFTHHYDAWQTQTFVHFYNMCVTTKCLYHIVNYNNEIISKGF